jgi:dinuclear metal center YbgI/SA1388 family protein
MTTVAELSKWLERFAPLDLAESWDNVGLLCGDGAAPVKRVMTCLTVTPESSQEAIRDGAGLIVTHHPIFFRPTKRIRSDDPHGAIVWNLARAGVAVYSPHTAFDNCVGGINDHLAERFGLLDIGPLRSSPAGGGFKVVVVAPRSDRDAVLEAAFAAGAGRIGDYEQCSFSSPGRGTFFGTEDANPAVGQAGRRETVREWKIEVVCSSQRLAGVLAAVRSRHSYEEPAIDVVPLHPQPSGPGIGRVGRMPRPSRLADFATVVAKALGSPATQFVGDADRRIERLAIVCGAGDDFIPDAARTADALLTGEARFHQALEASELGVGLILAGHHATERPGVEALAARLQEAFPNVTVWASRHERDPLRALQKGRSDKK